MKVNIDGLNINYTDVGSGVPVLLLHGWGSSCEVYKGVINTLSSRCRLVAPDFPGCGGSDIMVEPWDLDKYCDFVLKFMKATGLENPIMMGHSHGGRVTLYMTAKGMVSPSKIVLFDAAGLIPRKSFKQKFRAKSFKTIKKVLTLPVIKNYSEGITIYQYKQLLLLISIKDEKTENKAPSFSIFPPNPQANRKERSHERLGKYKK